MPLCGQLAVKRKYVSGLRLGGRRISELPEVVQQAQTVCLSREQRLVLETLPFGWIACVLPQRHVQLTLQLEGGDPARHVRRAQVWIDGAQALRFVDRQGLAQIGE